MPEDLKLAEKIRKHLQAHPDANSVQEISGAVKANVDDVAAVLDEHLVTDDGITHVGPGGGGGWLTQEKDEETAGGV